MKSIIILISMLLCGCAGTLDKFKTSYDMPKANEYWIERNPPSQPLNQAETLAVLSAAKTRTLKINDMTAYYDREDGLNQLVILERISKEETISLKYRITDGRISGETVPAYATVRSQEKEEFAREVALNAVNGSSTNIPVLLNGRAYIAKYNGKCNVDVVEKDLNKVYYTYHVNTCQDVLAFASTR